ncbi:hypothetical protein DIURU_005176 [Diutina rugosa]|uniref:Ras modification protein ERF4 n=1 Tax=Diutina rugosa TaxID=5481 RepID=A0A642UEF0_DIURU|nr:uncharacterized protein DIURU_005176 [Diutina rugosa]KAA8897577.1 hypothetical protein DIURU_005176 [Diutina rugosa]
MAATSGAPTLSGQADHPEPKSDQPAPLEFFNYHEYLVESADGQLVATHFPNGYTNTTSPEFATTRVVRVPRVYHDNEDSDVVPQFSTVVPGAESYAISDGSRQFNPVALVDGNAFGKTSWTPLVPDNLTATKFQEIVATVNTHLQAAFRPSAWATAENIVDIVSGGIWSSVYGESACKRALAELDAYIDATNASITPVRLVHPRQSGFLSLDFCIPAPKVGSES